MATLLKAALLIVPALALAECPPPVVVQSAYCHVPVVTFPQVPLEYFSTGKVKTQTAPERMNLGKYFARADAQCVLADYVAAHAGATGYVHTAYLGASSWCD